jgi:hypothetical protein
MTFNEYENEPTFFIPKKIFYSDERELTDEFCKWCCPNSFESNKCDEGRCIEFEEHMEKYTMTYDVDKDAIERLIIELQEERDHYKLQTAELREKLRWIPVSERLPEHIKDVLCLGHFGGKTVASRSFKSDGWFVYDMDGKVIKLNIDEVKYWMEIPELGDGE